MICSTEVNYTHQKDQNNYNVYYHGGLIGTVRYTPAAAGTWTFTSSEGDAEAFGSTRLQAVGYYLEHLSDTQV